MSIFKPKINLNLVDNEIPITPISEKVRFNPLPIMPNEMVKNLCSPFFLKLSDLEVIMGLMNIEMSKSLKNIENGAMDLKMLNTHVSTLPNGEESGKYLSIDMVERYHKLSIIQFDNKDQEPVVYENTYVLPKEYTTCSAEEFFSYLARNVEEFIQTHTTSKRVWNACVSVPFAMHNKSLLRAKLIAWSKDYNIRQVLGIDFADLLQKALNKTTVKVKCNAIINDCVSVLASCAVNDIECVMAISVGDGVNAAYFEKIANVRRDETFPKGATFVIINTELAGLGDGGCLNRFLTEFDKRLGRACTMPGIHTFEKMVAGYYLGEIVRHILIYLTEKNQLFSNIVPASLKERNSFPTRFICEIDRDPPHLFYSTEYILREDLKIQNLKSEDLRIVRYVCSAVTYRSACLSAAATACILTRLQRMRVTIGVNGFLFRMHPNYANMIIQVMTRLIPNKCTFRLKLSGISNGKGGAAILASLNRKLVPSKRN